MAVFARTLPMSDSVLARVARGDVTAVPDCIQRFGGLVWTLARRLSPNAKDAEEAVAEIFAELWKSAKSFDARAASDATFVAMIARRRLLDRLRARHCQGDDTTTTDVPESTPSPRSQVAADAAWAAKALEQLPPEQRRVLFLAAYYGMSPEEIATRTGMANSTVKAHARRGLLRIREVLASQGGRA